MKINQTWTKTYEAWIKTQSKFYFIIDKREFKPITDNSKRFNETMKKFILHNLFDKCIDWKEITDANEFVNSIPTQSIVYCIKPAKLQNNGVIEN